MTVFKGCMAMLTGVALLVSAVVDVRSTRHFVHESIVVPGRVIRLDYGPHHPDIAFTTLAGERIEYPQGGDVDVDLGDAVEVRYLPADPRSSARMNAFWALWGGPITFGAAGALFMLAGLRAARSSGACGSSGASGSPGSPGSGSQRGDGTPAE
ncbi:DUF3592 domain-containing protein [Burkholderia paludis]|uniref:DUF3592 domain-containing protein n=1 Tax=Burkholderia paludis TaxID=1506587 RepID=UPI0007C718E7|nr:DUF3592 domain-containing protein [Burkholderia paludis]